MKINNILKAAKQDIKQYSQPELMQLAKHAGFLICSLCNEKLIYQKRGGFDICFACWPNNSGTEMNSLLSFDSRGVVVSLIDPEEEVGCPPFIRFDLYYADHPEQPELEETIKE